MQSGRSVPSDRMVYLGVVAPLVLAIVMLLALCIGGFSHAMAGAAE